MKNRFLTYLVGSILVVEFFTPPETAQYPVPVSESGGGNYPIIIAPPSNDNLTTAVIAAVAAELVHREISAVMNDGRPKREERSA